jgi:hypothetical protein
LISLVASRIYHLRGSPRVIGLAIGRGMGPRLEQNIHHYLTAGPAKQGGLDWERLRHGALPWLHSLPQRFQEELQGMAEGAGLPLQRIAEWCFADECLTHGCSAFLCSIGGQIWVGRNNDIWVPDLWGYVTIREVEDRIPSISFGMEGEPFTPTGINQEQLWLHYNYLPVWDAPGGNKPSMAPYVFLTEALETCRTLEEVGKLLGEVDRSGGMMIFAAEGATQRGAVFECTCTSHVRHDLSERWLAGTNHYLAGDTPLEAEVYAPNSVGRYTRLVALLGERIQPGAATQMPRDLVHILANPGIEQRGEAYGTVYANVACPGDKAVWYTLGGYPAASAGAWQPIDWPWA